MNSKTKLLALVVAVLPALNGCAGRSVNEAKDIDTKLDVKGNLNNEKIGVDGKNDMVVQEEVAVENELQQIRWRTYDTEKTIAFNYSELDRCSTELADPRLGGNGKVVDLPEHDVKKDTSKMREELGLNEKKEIKLVRKEGLVDRLQGERKYEEQLGVLAKNVDKERSKCERQLGYARVQHGLPAGRFKAQGHVTQDGGWASTQQSEHSLDDAFQAASKTPQFNEAPGKAIAPTVKSEALQSEPSESSDASNAKAEVTPSESVKPTTERAPASEPNSAQADMPKADDLEQPQLGSGLAKAAQ